MKAIFFFLFIIILQGTAKADANKLPAKKEVMHKMEQVNNYLMKKWPDPGVTVTTNIERSSNLWTRGTYYEGLMALYQIDPKKEYYDYAVEWGSAHKWMFRNNRDPHNNQIYTTHANHLCAAQTYVDLYELDPQWERIENVKLNLDSTIRSGVLEDWDWVDALQMAMPVYSKMGRIFKDEKYFDFMHKGYLHTRNEVGGGLFNEADGLWWRDADFVPPYKEPNGEDCYWSRGNGWAYAALVRVLEDLPEGHKYRKLYLDDFKAMSEALIACQREDGFWNVSLHDPTNFGGKESTGTIFFVYGLAWGLNNGILGDNYVEPAFRAWKAVSTEAIRPNGSLAFLQGTGKEPKDGQPVTYDSQPDFEDYGIGAFLLGASEVYKYLYNKELEAIPNSELANRLENIFYSPDFIKIPQNTYCVSDFGAKGDGVFDNTKIIQSVIDKAAKNGGGIITFKPGIYMTTSLFIKSNIEFRIDGGVSLKAIQDDSLYPKIETRIAGIEMAWPAALINVNGQENVKITGRGIIDCNGEYWWRKYWGDGPGNMGGMRKDYQDRNLRWAVDYDCERLRTLVVDKSKNVLLKDFTIKRSGFWTVTFLYSERCHADGIIVRNNIDGFGPSSDGINTDSSTDILVENCDVDCDDDNFCIKSGRDADGLRVNIPSKNVVYRNSIARAGHGLFTLGSETSGGMENIEAYNLSSYGTSNGLRLKSAKVRGGLIKNIYFHDIKMTDTKRPFQFELNWHPSYSNVELPEGMTLEDIPAHWKKLLEPVMPPELGIPEFRDVRIENITVTGADRAFYADAHAEKPMDNFTWKNVSIEAKEAGQLKNVSNWKMENVKVKADFNKLILINCNDIDIPQGLTYERKQ